MQRAITLSIIIYCISLSLFRSPCVCLCVCSCACRTLTDTMYLLQLLFPPFFWDRHFHETWSFLCNWTGWWMSHKDCPVSACLALRFQGMSHGARRFILALWCQAFYISYGDSNSGSHACVTTALRTECSLQSTFIYFKWTAGAEDSVAEFSIKRSYFQLFLNAYQWAPSYIHGHAFFLFQPKIPFLGTLAHYFFK